MGHGACRPRAGVGTWAKRGYRSSAVALCLLLNAPAWAQSSTQKEILERLQRLEQHQAEQDKLIKAKDARIDELEAEVERLKAKPAADTVTPPSEVSAEPTPATAAQAAAEPSPVPDAETSPELGEVAAAAPYEKYFGTYALGRGFGLVRNEWGEVRFGIYTYVRYLNSKGVDDTYVNGLGQEVELDKRDDLELNKVKIEFRGWMLDPKFQYVLYSWTNNAAMGQGAQVVLGGNLKYAFSDAFLLGGGILSLPTTRSTSGNFPYWLTVDHRTAADEFFRGS